ncbi:unnamed protein product [Choristocarpus tenellus]
MEEMLNMVLLSCGAPYTVQEGEEYQPYTPPEGVYVPDMSDEEWSEVMDRFLQDIKDAPATTKEGGGGGIGGGVGPFPLADAPKGKAGKALRKFRLNYLEVFRRLAEASRRGISHNTRALMDVVDTLTIMSGQESADVRMAAILAAMEV